MSEHDRPATKLSTNTSAIPQINRASLDTAVAKSVAKVKSHLARWKGGFPSSASVDGRYGFYTQDNIVDGDAWTSGFWPGLQWLAYEASGDDAFKREALSYIQLFDERLINRIWVDHHDIGFLYSLSCVPAYKVTEDLRARAIALRAAELLLTRYSSKGRFIQAWGALNDRLANRLIIDSLMNLPLLYWASQTSGDSRFRAVADSHLRTTLDHTIRPDGSTYHTFFFDLESGAPVNGVTRQGFSDASCWARGQAWAIYGIALSMRHTRGISLIPPFERVTDYFLRHLPADHVCYWDLCFQEGPEERDSSAATIAVCGLLEALQHLPPGELRDRCESAAHRILLSLIENYTAGTEDDGLLLHAVYSKPHQAGVDECCIWGDYFFLEALVRLRKDWMPYW